MNPDSLAARMGIRVDGAEEAQTTLAHLHELAERIDDMTRAERGAAMATLLGEHIGGCSALARTDPTAWAAVLERLRAPHGMSAAVNRLEKRVKAASRGLRVAEPGETQPQRPADVSWAPDGWTCPPTWSVADSGVWGPDPQGEGEIQVSRVPLLPVGRLLDVDTGEHHVRLMWPGWTGQTYTRVVRQSVTVDARTLVATLGDHGGGVTSGNGGLMVRFLDSAMAANASTMPVELVASRCGWVSHGDATGFLLGTEWVGDGDVALQVDPSGGEAQLLSGVRTSGTWAGWLEAMATVADCPDAHLAVYASVASVLVSHLGTARGWVVDWSGETSQGKTTALRVAASVWGEPTDGRMLGSWRSTPVQIEAAAALYQHLPLILDDSKNARRPEEVATVIYQHSQGRGKGRGKPGVGSQAVGMRRTAEWSSVLLSTGEQSAVSFTQDAGSRARCLCLMGPPMRTDEQARAVTVGVLEHHGHLGRRVVEHLTRLSDAGWASMRRDYDSRVRRYSEHLSPHGAVAQRLGGLLALLAVAQGVAESVGYPPAPRGCEPLKRAGRAIVAGGQDADRPLEALRAVYEHIAARQSSMWGRHAVGREGEPLTPSGGWLGAWPKDEARRSASWGLAVLPGVVDDVLAARGFDKGVVDRWRERGWLATSGTSYRVPVRLDGARVRTMALTPAAMSALGLGAD